MLKTERLILRPWKDEDFGPFAKLTADPRVMEHFPSILTRQESDKLAKKFKDKIEDQGWGFWAVSVPGICDFIGYVGLGELDKLNFPAHFTPAVEIGWRLAYEYWGKGYAPEAARACLEHGFKTLHLSEIVAFTATENARSMKVMEKIGMQRNPEDDFDHPNLPEGHRLRRHVLYRITPATF